MTRWIPGLGVAGKGGRTKILRQSEQRHFRGCAKGLGTLSPAIFSTFILYHLNNTTIDSIENTCKVQPPFNHFVNTVDTENHMIYIHNISKLNRRSVTRRRLFTPWSSRSLSLFASSHSNNIASCTQIRAWMQRPNTSLLVTGKCGRCQSFCQQRPGGQARKRRGKETSVAL